MSYRNALARRGRATALLGIHDVARACCYPGSGGKTARLGHGSPGSVEEAAGVVARSWLSVLRPNEWTETVLCLERVLQSGMSEGGAVLRVHSRLL